MSEPATVAVPLVGLSDVERMRSVVVFPAPLGPRIPKISPVRQENETPSTARTGPFFFVPLNTFTSSRTSIGTAPADCGTGASFMSDPPFESLGAIEHVLAVRHSPRPEPCEEHRYAGEDERRLKPADEPARILVEAVLRRRDRHRPEESHHEGPQVIHHGDVLRDSGDVRDED